MEIGGRVDRKVGSGSKIGVAEDEKAGVLGMRRRVGRGVFFDFFSDSSESGMLGENRGGDVDESCIVLELMLGIVGIGGLGCCATACIAGPCTGGVVGLVESLKMGTVGLM